MAFIIDKQGNYIPVLGETTGGGAPANFIPDGTVYNIKADGTGDFNTLNEAIDYLEGKWSTGNVKIKFGAGTFTHTESVSIRGGNYFSIPLLTVEGESATDTILEFTHNTATQAIKVFNTTAFDLRNVTVKRVGGDKTTDLRGILSAENARVLLNKVTTDGCNYAINAQQNGTISLIANIVVKNCNLGICAEGGIVSGNWAVSTDFSDVTTAFYVAGGGIIKIPYPTYTATNVTNKSSQTVGTATASGWITGFSS